MSGDPLAFPGYAATLSATAPGTESVVTGTAEFGGVRWCVIASDFDFIGGSMGAATGERVVRAYERATAERQPVLVVAASGGARMQEGMAALVQMARTAAAAQRHAHAGLLQVAYLCSPTTGGVYASFASLADLVWAEPAATIGFAGPRVVEQTTGTALPAGAHTTESAAAAGLIDGPLDLDALPDRLARLAPVLAPDPQPATAPPPLLAGSPDDPHGQVKAVRSAGWTSSGAVAGDCVADPVALAGDRMGGRARAVTTGLGVTRSGRPVMIITLERHPRPGPADFRVARRAVSLAARLRLPVVTFVDTPGADPSHESEQGGIAGEIARLMAAVATHPVATVSIVTGEGGSGGALAFSACDRLYLLDGAVFSVIAPEGAAAILHRDAARAADVAPLLKLTGADLTRLGIIDGVIGPGAAAGAVEHALATAQPGDGRARFDRATGRAVIEHPT